MSFKPLLSIFNLNWTAQLFALFISFIAPITTVIHVIVLLLIVDALTSIYYQMKVVEKQGGYFKTVKKRLRVIESSKLRKTIEKLFFYVLVLIVFFSFDKYVIKVDPISEYAISTFSITNISAILISMVELTSIASNVSKITGNPIFNKIVSILQKKVDNKIDEP